MFDRQSKLLGLLAVVAAAVWLAVFGFDNKTHFVFCDVGQGDAILVSRGFTQVLIDGGPDQKVLDCLSGSLPFFDRTVEVVISTHPDGDHLTGIIPVFDKYRVKYFVASPVGSASAVYMTLLTRVEEAEAKVVNLYAGDRLRLAGMEFLTLWPQRDWLAEKIRPGSGQVLGAATEHKNLNDFSLVFLVKAKDKKVLLMGDADSQIQSRIASDDLGQIDILKYAHHGSKTGMREDFLKKLNAKEAVISVGQNNFGHPAPEALSLLEKYKVKIRRTDVEGEVEYVF